MKWAWRVILALAVGAVLQTLIAWVLVLNADIFGNLAPQQEIPVRWDAPRGAWLNLGGDLQPTIVQDVGIDPVVPYPTFASSEPVGCDLLQRLAAMDAADFDHSLPWTGYLDIMLARRTGLDAATLIFLSVRSAPRRFIVDAGWPCRSLTTAALTEDGPWLSGIEVPDSMAWGRERYPGLGLVPTAALPIGPLWAGLAANSAIYGGAVFVLFFGRGLLVRRSRRRRGACEKCGYDVRGLAKCPECGAANSVVTPSSSSEAA